MKQEEFEKQKAAGNITPLPQPENIPQESGKQPLAIDFEMYLALLEAMQRPRQHLTTAPDFVPRNFAEQIQFYDDEAGTPVRRVYFYFNQAWSYITLT
jgi:hypothetical protein